MKFMGQFGSGNEEVSLGGESDDLASTMTIGRKITDGDVSRI